MDSSHQVSVPRPGHNRHCDLFVQCRVVCRDLGHVALEVFLVSLHLQGILSSSYRVSLRACHRGVLRHNSHQRFPVWTQSDWAVAPGCCAYPILV